MKTDTLYIKQIQADGHHNYTDEIGDKEKSTSTTQPSSEASNIDGYKLLESPLIQGVSIVILIVFVVIIVYMLIKNYAAIEPNVDIKVKGMGDDTIYGHEWDDEIKQMLASGNFSEVVVLCYLRMLEKLNEEAIISFNQAKTPNMFIAEAESKMQQTNDAKRLENLKTLTSHYLRIRYGHKQATKELAEEMLNLL